MAEEAKKNDVKKEAPKKEDVKTPEVKKPEVKKEEKKKEAVVKPDNCMKCNKRLQKKAWYYRDGKYYCSKRCWKLAVTEKKKT